VTTLKLIDIGHSINYGDGRALIAHFTHSNSQQQKQQHQQQQQQHGNWGNGSLNDWQIGDWRAQQQHQQQWQQQQLCCCDNNHECSSNGNNNNNNNNSNRLRANPLAMLAPESEIC